MRENASHNEKQLLIAAGSGDQRAFAELFHRFQPVIYTIVLRISRSERMAEDIAQDCFLKAWLQREKLQQLDNFGAWLHVMAANLTYNALRRRKADLTREETYSDEQESGGSFMPTETMLLEKEYASLLQEAVTALPERQRQVFVLIRQQGLTREEAASALGVSSETIKSNLQIATQKIRAYCVGRMGLIGTLLLAWAGK